LILTRKHKNAFTYPHEISLDPTPSHDSFLPSPLAGTKDKKKTVLKLYGKQHAFLEQIKDDYKLASKDVRLR
jgi:hypothetical protein